MKLNNKGFAITAILYTVLILFLMILLSVIGGLNIKRKLLETNVNNIKEKLEPVCENYKYEQQNPELVIAQCEQTTEPLEIKYNGKYIFAISKNSSNEIEIYETYLASGDKICIKEQKLFKVTNISEEEIIEEINFINVSSNNDINTAVLVARCTKEKTE